MINRVKEDAFPIVFQASEQQEKESQFTDLLQVMLAGIALILLSPLFVCVFLALRFTSPGPLLYRGARVGKDGRIFYINKFRTLQVNAEKQIGARLLNEKDTDLYTPLGRFLKKSKLDELPQLWNVFRGDMCFVGPRPIRPIFLQQSLAEIPGYADRFRVKPGMTGLAQTRGTYFTHPRNKLRYERLYIKHRSWLLDLKIIAHTLLKIFHRWMSLGFLLLALFLFVSFTPAAVLSSFYLSVGGIRFNLVHAGIVLCGVWLLGRQLPSERLSLYTTPLYLPMGVFLLCSLVTAYFSFDGVQALRGSAYYLVTGFLFALSIANSKVTRHFISSAITIVATTAVALSAIGLLKLLVFDYLSTTEAAFSSTAAILTSPQGISGTFGSPEALAAYLTLAVPPLLNCLGRAKETGARDFWVVGATLTFVGILLTKTPVALCALALTAALYMWRYFRPALLVGFAFAVSPFFLLSVASTNAVADEGHFLSSWLHHLTQASPVHLLFGYGARTLNESGEAVQALAHLVSLPDSAYGALLIENGVLGLGAMLWIVLATLRCLYRAYQDTQDEEIRSVLWATFCSLIGFLISLLGFNAFSNLTLQILFWSAVGFGIGVGIHQSGKRKELLLDLKLKH
jgi:lipopolysaccharide/colanic/teichoic acid biosynthesis glycosyltransferase